MNAYSKDLRLRGLGAVDRRTPRKGVGETFSVSLATVKRWLKRRLKTGGAETKPILDEPPRRGRPYVEGALRGLR